ncbi:hypothetical protein L209DRAFT_755387 [Thermothelomyces heterothallicus CBS 203.75]
MRQTATFLFHILLLSTCSGLVVIQVSFALITSSKPDNFQAQLPARKAVDAAQHSDGSFS